MKTPIRFLVLLLALAFLPGFARVSPAAYAVTDKAMVQQAIRDTEKELQGWRDRLDDLRAASEGDSFAKRKLSYGKPGEDPTISVIFNSGGNLRIGDESAEHAMGQGYSGDAEAECRRNIARLEADLETQRKELAKIEEEERKEIEEAWKRQWEIEKRKDREQQWGWDWMRDRELAAKGKPGYTMEAVDRHYRTGAGSRENYINGTQQPFSPKTTLHTEPTAATPSENGGGSAPSGGGSLDKFLDQQTQASENRGNDSKILNQYTTQEKEQESKNTIARQDAENTVNQGGQNSQTINQQSASTTAESQDQNSWQNTIVGAFEESITGGLVSMGTTFAENAAQNFVNKLFPPEKQPDDPSAGGGGGGGGQNGGQPGGKKSGGKKGGGGGKKGGGGGGGGHDHGEDEVEGGEGGSSEGDSGDHDDDTGGGYDDGTGGGYDDGGKVTFNTPGYVGDGGSSESDEDDGQKICIRCKQKKSYLEWDKDAIGWVCYDCLNRTVPKEEPQEEESSGCGGPVHHGCGGCVYEAEWDDDKGGRFWKCEKCGHKDHWGPWLE